MSGFTLSLLIAAMFVLLAVFNLGEQPICVLCGGRSAHRKDCPENRG